LRRLFGTDGVRGVVNVDLTPELALSLSIAIGTYFKPGSRILVGYDTRAGNTFLVPVIIGGLVSTGVKVYNGGLAPTPAIQYYIKKAGFDGGVVVTASHNPPEYSGVKVVMADGIEAPREVEEEIERILHESRFRRAPWSELSHGVTRVSDVVTRYVEGILELVDTDKVRRSDFRVAVDPANSVGALATPTLLRRLGVKVVTVNGELSSTPSRNPEPSPENIVDLVRYVQSSGVDLGVAHDGDADRAIFVADGGIVVPGDSSAVLLCQHIVENRGEREPPRVVTAVSSSTIVERVLGRYGIEVVWTRVGSIVIARTMLSLGAVAGFEENGGFMYPRHQYVRDGAMAVALMLELLSYSGRKLSELVSYLPKRYIIKRRVYAPKELLPEVYEELRRRFPKARVVDVDGVKVIDESFWILVRPSGTEPLIRVFVEGESEEVVGDLFKEVLEILKEVCGCEVRTA